MLTSPRMTIETHLAIVVVLRFCHALFHRVQVNMQVEPLADLLADFRCRGIGAYECKSCIKEYCANRLWLFKQELPYFLYTASAAASAAPT